MAVTCFACGHWSLSGEHQCLAPLYKRLDAMAGRQLVIQLPDKPGLEYDDLLIAITALANRMAREPKEETP